MFHRALVSLGGLVVIVGLSLAFLAQRYWFARAYRFVGRIQDRSLRKAVRGLLLVLLAVVAVTAIVDIVMSMRGTPSHGSWWSAFFGFWLISSIVSYLLIEVIAGADGLWSRLSSPRSVEPRATISSDAPAQRRGIDHSRRHFFQAAGIFAGAVPFVSFAYGFVLERFHFEIREINIPIPNLPVGLDGLRITQLSDIHVGSYMPISQVRRAVGMANELGGDLMILTGDYLTRRGDPLEDCITELSRLHAPLGIWGCNGNHEIYASAEQQTAELFKRFGMRLLRSENAELRWNGSPFNLIGVDYQRQRDMDGNRLEMLVGVDSMVRRDVPNILLSHNPNSFPRAAELGIQLSLAGHTHGGQVRVEILDHRWTPANFLTPYVAGLYKRPEFSPEHISDGELLPQLQALPPSQIYVNRGLGTIGAPVRLGVPPEITLITLRRA